MDLKAVAQEYFDKLWLKCNDKEKERFEVIKDVPHNFRMFRQDDDDSHVLQLYGLYHVTQHGTPFLFVASDENEAIKARHALEVDVLFPMIIVPKQGFARDTDLTNSLCILCSPTTLGQLFLNVRDDRADPYHRSMLELEVDNPDNTFDPSAQFFDIVFSCIIFFFNKSIQAPCIKNHTAIRRMNFLPCALLKLRAKRRVWYSSNPYRDRRPFDYMLLHGRDD